MSQRLHVGPTTERFYDCVLLSPDGALDKLRTDFLARKGDFYLGPFKIRVGDFPLLESVEPLIRQVLAEVGERYPEDVMAFYRSGSEPLCNPTEDELRIWKSLPSN